LGGWGLGEDSGGGGDGEEEEGEGSEGGHWGRPRVMKLYRGGGPWGVLGWTIGVGMLGGPRGSG
jgi:hypothetical protein